VVFGPGPSVAAHRSDPKLAALLVPGSPGFEPFRVLRTKVRALGETSCLGLVSATAREGTSTVALGLAAALAQERDRRVLLIEATLRSPALSRVLGLSEERGLSEWLEERSERPVPTRRIEPLGCSLLTAGAAAPQSAELLASDTMRLLVAQARQSFDVVLLDCPPLESVADSVVLQDLLDGFLLVVRARHASRDAIRRSLSSLRADAIRGVVFNDRTEMLARWLDRRRPRERH
jgi:capsular exopolysaccharide synthesis family protein